MPVPNNLIQPYWASPDGKKVKMYLGDVRKVLYGIPAKSVQTVVTSPPYWGLRDYGTATWEGGGRDCNHKVSSTLRTDRPWGKLHPANQDRHENREAVYKKVCGRCGAKRIDHQIGSEPSPDCGTHGQAQCGQCFVCTLVEVFRGVRRVLRDDGLAWLNLGDTYSGGGGYWPSAPGNQNAGSLSSRQDNGSGAKPVGPYYKGLPSGNLIGVPWRVALALQHDGWVLRQDVIWSKMSCMPSSVRNRCTTSHEYVFLLAKKMGYYYDADAVKEKGGGHKTGGPMNYKGVSGREYGWQNKDAVYQSANKRSVWHISNEGGYEHSHFATFPKKLVEPCILAGTSAKGACVKCGAPWQRVVDERTIIRNRSTPFVKRTGQAGTGNSCPNDVGGVSSRTVGWYPTCKCDGLPELPKEPPAGGGWNATKESADGTYKIQGNGCPSDDNWDRVNGIRGEDYDNWVDEVTKLCEAAKDIPTTPCVVLDPFCGSGTTAVVSLQHGRHAVGIELSKQYMDLHIIPRMNRCVVNPFAETKQFREKNNKLLGKLVQKDRIPKLPKGK